MGQKVNPNGLRIGINRGWESSWYASKKDYSKYLGEDIKIREYLEKKLKEAITSHIDIAREKSDKGNRLLIQAYVARPGVVLGNDGEKQKLMESELRKMLGINNLSVRILEAKNQDLDATLMAKWIASELENRQSFRSTQKKAMQRILKAGAKGCKTSCGGRLGGAEIARKEGYKRGVIPLETLRADIDFASVHASTAYGNIGVKVWICRSLNKKEDEQKREKEGGKQ